MTFKLTLIGFIAVAASIVSAESSLFSLFKKAQSDDAESLVNRGYVGYCAKGTLGQVASRYRSGDTFSCYDGEWNWNCYVISGGYSCSGSSGLKTMSLVSNSPQEIENSVSLYNYGNVGYCNKNTLPYVAGRYTGSNQFSCTDGRSTWYCSTSGQYYYCSQYGLSLADNSTTNATEPESLYNRGYVGTCRSYDLGSIARRYSYGDTFQCQDGRTRWSCTSYGGSGYSCSGTTYKQDFLKSLADSTNATDAAPQSLYYRGYQGYCTTSAQRSAIASRYQPGDTFQCSAGGSSTWNC